MHEQTSERRELLDVLIVLARSWKRVALTTALFLILGIATSYVVFKPSYTSIAVILPPATPHSFASALTGQSEITGTMGASQQPARMATETCIAILSSQGFDDEVIAKYHLQTVWKQTSVDATRRRLRSEVQIEATGFETVRITVRDHDPRLASELANEFVNQLNRFAAGLAVSEAEHRRAFFAEEVKLEATTLREAEDQLKQSQQGTALISPGSQSVQAVQDISELHRAIRNDDARLQSLRSFDAESNPDVVRSKAAREAHRGQLSRLQSDSRKRRPGDAQIPATRLAGDLLQNQRATRDVTEHGRLLAMLKAQLAAATVDQARSESPVPFVDRAIAADWKSGPQRTLIWLGFCWVGFASACLWIFLREALNQSQRDRTQTRKFAELRHMLGLPASVQHDTM